MPTVEITITVSIPEGGATLGEVEEAVGRAVEEAGQRLLLAACGELEEEALVRLRRMRGRVQQVKVRPLDMLTRFGWVRVQRRQVVQREDGRYFCPLDDVLGLGPRQHASPWVQGQAVALATRIPYRQAIRLRRSRVAGHTAGPPHGIRLGAAGGAGCGGRRGRPAAGSV